MKKITLLFLTMLFSAITYGQTFPSISDENSETWYYIQFERAGGNPAKQGVIQDMGEGVNLLTKQARENTDSQLWKVTGTAENYVITNKLGRSIDYSGNTYKAAATTTISLSIDADNHATFEGFEIRRAQQPKFMNQNGGGGFERTLGEWNYGDQGNVLNFRLAADVVGGLESALTATLPTVGKSYHIKFRKGNALLKDMGADNLVKTAIPEEGALDQLWKISGTQGDYTLTSDNGNILDFDGTKFTTSATSTVKFTLLENLPGWEIQRVGSTKAMNQDGGFGYDKDLAEWTVGDANNPIDFIEAGKIAYYPKMSAGGTDYWYFIQFDSSLGAITDQGDDATLLTSEAVASEDSQLWKATGTFDAFTLTNKASGRTISYNSTTSRYVASSTNSSPFKAIANVDGTSLNLQHDGSSKGINQFGGATLGAELGEWTINDANNLLKFTLESNGPILSTRSNSIDVITSVYPNPFKNSFSFNLKNKTSKNASVKIYSILGKVVKMDNIVLKNGQGTVDGSTLSKGVYIVQIETLEGKSNLRIIKQ